MRRLTNCIIEGGRLWLKGRMQPAIGLMRSVSLRGWIPHVIVVGRHAKRPQTLYTSEYAPRDKDRKEDFGDPGAMPVVFDGEWTVRRYRLEKEVKAPTWRDGIRELCK